MEHLRGATFPALRRLPGFVDASILRREVPEGVEFLIVTRWGSLEAIRAFAGANVDAAVVPEAVAAMMVDYDRWCVTTRCSSNSRPPPATRPWQ